MKRLLQNFWIRTLLCVLIAAILFGLAVALPRYIRQRSTLPRQDLAALRSNLNQNLLAYRALSYMQPDGPSTSQHLASARSSLQSSVDRIKPFLENPPKGLNSGSVTKLKEALDRQIKLLADLDSRSGIFGTAVSYNPEDNLGINLEQHGDVAANRAKTATVALEKLKTGQLQLKNTNNLNEAISCFNDFISNTESESYNEAKSGLNDCVNTYEKLRKDLVMQIVTPFSNDKATPGTVKTTIEELDRLLAAV